MVEALAKLLQPWADLYAGATLVEGTVVFLHLAALVVAGGLAIATDRAIVRAGAASLEARRHTLQELGSAHGVVLAGLAVLVGTGGLMLLADVEALLPSWLFWVKMGFFALLIVNGVTLRRAQSRLSAGGDLTAWGPLRAAAVRSSALWLLLLLIGSVLPIVA